MASQNENWTRLYAVIQWAGMTTNYFAHHIGLPCGENLYQIKRGNNGISRDVAERIVTKFPDINKAWLLTGLGHMFNDDASTASSFSFFKTGVEDVKSLSQLVKDDYKMFVPQLESCDLALLYNSRAMDKSLPYGSTIFLKKVQVDNLISGNIYVVVTKNFTLVRRAYSSAANSTLTLESDNRESFEDIHVEADNVNEIYHIMGHLVVNA